MPSAGLLFKCFHIRPERVASSEALFRVVTLLISACGMMVFGLGTSQVTFSWSAIRGALTLVVCRHVLAVLAIEIVIGLCIMVGFPVKPDSLKVVFLIGLLPLASNLVVFAAQLGTGVTGSSLLIAISTILTTPTALGWGVALSLA